MRASYIVRFDDICPTMDWSVWNRVERAIRHLSIRPIIAVVPDNRDPHLSVAPARSDFWDRVREWERLGWSIAMHGYQHLYSTSDAGIVGLNRRSEFAGLPRDEQLNRIDAALKIFAEQQVRPTAWVAPGHSFDWNTVECLKERDLFVVSDGFFSRPVRYRGMIWVPQQLWRFRSMGSGVWTVCSHVNGWHDSSVTAFVAQLEAYRDAITCLDDVLSRPIRDHRSADRVFSLLYGHLVRTKRMISGRS